MNRIILVEDNPADAALARIALADIAPETELTHCTNGLELFDLLQREGAEGTAVVLLDLNMPGMNGFDVLKNLRGDDRFHHLPVVVFSSSAHYQDVLRSYDYGANAYVAKPMDMEHYDETMSSIVQFWGGLNRRV